MRYISVDVISPLPEGWGLCLSCEVLLARANLDKAPPERGLEEYPPEWQADFERLSQFIFHLADRFGDQILLRVWDPRSLQGVIKSIRYGVRSYPAFIIAGNRKVSGWDMGRIEETILEALRRDQPLSPVG